jgi:hypothetical protein
MPGIQVENENAEDKDQSWSRQAVSQDRLWRFQAGSVSSSSYPDEKEHQAQTRLAVAGGAAQI